MYPYENSGTPLSTFNHALGINGKGFQSAVLIPSAELNFGFTKNNLSDFCLYKIPKLEKHNAFFGLYDQNILLDYKNSIESILNDFQPDVIQVNDYVYLPIEIVDMLKTENNILIRNVCNDEEICHFDSPVISNNLEGIICPGPTSADKCIECFLANKIKLSAEEFGSNKTKLLKEGSNRRKRILKKLYTVFFYL